MKNNNLWVTVGATTLITIGALGLALTGDKNSYSESEGSFAKEDGYPIRNTYTEIIELETSTVGYYNVVDTANRKAEEERQHLLEEQRKKEELERKKAEEAKNDLGIFNVSFYTANCYKCSGISKSGVDLRKSTKYQGYGVVASSWSQIPAYSIIEIEGLGQYIVLDTGGRIKTGHLDVLVKSRDEAIK